jgi:hypothetical protein
MAIVAERGKIPVNPRLIRIVEFRCLPGGKVVGSVVLHIHHRQGGDL